MRTKVEQLQDTEIFISALEQNDLNLLRQVPKGDLHVHGYLGGTKSDFESLVGRSLLDIMFIPKTIPEIFEVATAFYRGMKLSGRELFEACFSATLIRAQRESLHRLDVDVNIRHLEYFDYSPKALRGFVDLLRLQISPHCDVRLYAGLDSQFGPEAQLDLLQNFGADGGFYGVDIYGGDESLETVKRFRRHYELAQTLCLRRKGHFGEFGDPKILLEAVKELDLHEVQHGVRAIEDDEVVNYLAENLVKLNVCPKMNEIMGVCRSSLKNPIAELHRRGVVVSLGSDNALLINEGVSEQYLSLYKLKTLDVSELDAIRKNTLDCDGPANE